MLESNSQFDNTPYRLLVVEDDTRIAKLLVQFLASEGFLVECVDNGEDAVIIITQSPPDLVILDLMLPRMDGVEVCNKVRPTFNKSILMLTAHEDEIQEVIAPNAGVDDYLTKPIRPHILLARVNALLRRQQKIPQALVRVNDLEIDRRKRSVTRRGELIPLLDSEFEMLWFFACHAAETVNRSDLFSILRGRNYDGLDRSIDMRISKLRKKLSENSKGKEYIRTIRQQGYLLLRD